MKQVVPSTSNDRRSHDRLFVARLQHAEHRHRELESRIQEMKRRTWLSPVEQIELTRCKKLKLQVKDEIAALSTAVPLRASS